MPKLGKILVAYKKSRFQQISEFLQSRDQDLDQCDSTLLTQYNEATIDLSSLSSLKEADARHRDSLETTIRLLEGSGYEVTAKFRGDIVSVDPSYQLVVCVGGDGTVLDVSKKISGQPILGVNSNRPTSIGYFCGVTPQTLLQALEEIELDAIKPIPLMRFFAVINDKTIPLPILNDLLVAHQNPAAVSTYTIQIANLEPENHRSSGVWIATPAGSTAAIRSAGGYVQPIESDNFQYLIREPYPLPQRPYRHLKGIRKLNSDFVIISKMRHGRLYLDGPHNQIPFNYGDRLTLERAPDLQIYKLSSLVRD